MIWGFFIHMGYEGNDHCKKQKQYTQAADASYVSFVFNVHYLHTQINNKLSKTWRSYRCTWMQVYSPTVLQINVVQ